MLRHIMTLYIKETASRYGMSIAQLAKVMGVYRQTIYYYIEQGDKNPLGQLEKIADAIGCSVDELFKGEPKEESAIKCPHCGKPLNIKIE